MTKDYKKLYNEALERAKKFNEKYGGGYAGYIFPELTESEDERMIKAILSAIRGGLDTEKFLEKHGTNYEEVEAYLEKQKPVVDAKPERVIKAARRVLNNWLDGTDSPDVSGDFAELEYAIREYDGEEKQKEQEEITMPNSTELIEMWEKEEAMLKEKDFRGDTWRVAQNAFMDGFAKGCGVRQAVY